MALSPRPRLLIPVQPLKPVHQVYWTHGFEQSQRPLQEFGQRDLCGNNDPGMLLAAGHVVRVQWNKGSHAEGENGPSLCNGVFKLLLNRATTGVRLENTSVLEDNFEKVELQRRFRRVQPFWFLMAALPWITFY